MTGLTLLQCRDLVAARQLSPVELTLALLEHVAGRDRELHAFVTVVADRAMRDAGAAEARIRRGEPLGPLHGVPFAVKDVFCTAGVLTTAGSRQLSAFVPRRDASAVARLRRAGGILLGKLTTHELAIGGPDFDLPWPPARNPWDPSRFAGGSSSGSGVAVATGMVPAALGTDTGGSVRSPSALCGVVGLKPTYGSISRRGMFPLAFSLDHVGPMTRTVADNRLLFGVLRGTDGDPVREPVADEPAGRLDGLRVGLVRASFDGERRAEPEVAAALVRAAGVLADLGATVEEAAIDPIDEYEWAGRVILQVESHGLHRHRLAAPERLGRRCRERLSAGAAIPAADYRRALCERRRLRSRLDAVLARHDLLLAGAALEPAPPLQDAAAVERHSARTVTMPFNVTGHPALAVPVGRACGMPVAMQLVGPHGGEAVLHRAGAAYEAARA